MNSSSSKTASRSAGSTVTRGCRRKLCKPAVFLIRRSRSLIAFGYAGLCLGSYTGLYSAGRRWRHQALATPAGVAGDYQSGRRPSHRCTTAGALRSNAGAFGRRSPPSWIESPCAPCAWCANSRRPPPEHRAGAQCGQHDKGLAFRDHVTIVGR